MDLLRGAICGEAARHSNRKRQLSVPAWQTSSRSVLDAIQLYVEAIAEMGGNTMNFFGSAP